MFKQSSASVQEGLEEDPLRLMIIINPAFGLGFRVWGLGFRGLGFRGFRV